MPEHFHILAYATEGTRIEKFLRGARRAVSGEVRSFIETGSAEFRRYCAAVGVDSSVFYTRTAGKSEFRFWKEKPRVLAITDVESIFRRLEYVHNNPVRKGLVRAPGDWIHSSFRFYNTFGPEDSSVEDLASGCRFCETPS